MTGLLNGLVTSYTETEKEMISVERTSQLDDIEREDWQHSRVQVGADWPRSPCVRFSDVVLRYRDDDAQSALANVNFTIKSGEKIGICGRTGSGKSSLLTALFRGHELTSGSICVDGVNIRDVQLGELRRKMSVIPVSCVSCSIFIL